MTTDVVCGMEIDEMATKFRVDDATQRFYFCSEGCLAEFKRHRADYVIEDPKEVDV